MKMKRMILIGIVLFLFVGTFFSLSKEGLSQEQFSITLLKYDPVPVEPGKSFYVWFSIDNNLNSRVDNVNVKFLDYFPFYLQRDEDRVKTINSIAPGSSAVVKYLVLTDTDATQGSNSIKIQYSTDGTNWIERSSDVVVQTHQAIVGIKDVLVTPKTILPGDDIELKLEISNLAESRVKDVSVSLGLIQSISQGGITTTIELPFTPKDSSAKKTIKDLMAKSSDFVVFGLNVDPDADIKSYKIPIYITYSDVAGEQYSINDLIGINVEDKTNILTILESSRKIVPDKKNSVDLKIVNKGFGLIKYMTAEIIESSEFEIISSDKYYLGNVDSDDYENVEFEIMPKKKEGTIKIPVIIRYNDASNKQYSIAEDVELSIMTPQEVKALNGNSGVTPVVIVGIVVVLVIFYFVRKKRKEKTK